LAKKEKEKKQREFHNRKAFHDFEISDIIEVGIELKGSEVKSIRAGRVNLKDSFIRIVKGEVFLFNMHIGALETTHTSYRPAENRDRKLLLHKKQINKFYESVTKDGYTIVPTKLYFNDKNFVKLNIGVGKGKKLHDKRQALKEKDMKKQTDRILKAWNR
jgi:SsrA-binding protein